MDGPDRASPAVISGLEQRSCFTARDLTGVIRNPAPTSMQYAHDDGEDLKPAMSPVCRTSKAPRHIQSYLDTESTKRHLGERIAKDCRQASLTSAAALRETNSPSAYSDHNVLGEKVRRKCMASASAYTQCLDEHYGRSSRILSFYADDRSFAAERVRQEYTDDVRVYDGQEYSIHSDPEQTRLDENREKRLDKRISEDEVKRAELLREVELDMKRQELLQNKRKRKTKKRKSRIDKLSKQHGTKLAPVLHPVDKIQDFDNNIFNKQEESEETKFSFTALKRLLEEEVPTVDDIEQLLENEQACTMTPHVTIQSKKSVLAKIESSRTSDQKVRKMVTQDGQKTGTEVSGIGRREQPAVMAWNADTAKRGVGFRSKRRGEEGRKCKP